MTGVETLRVTPDCDLGRHTIAPIGGMAMMWRMSYEAAVSSSCRERHHWRALRHTAWPQLSSVSAACRIRR